MTGQISFRQCSYEIGRVYRKLLTGPNTAKERGILRRRRARLKRALVEFLEQAPDVYEELYGGCMPSYTKSLFKPHFVMEASR